MLVSVQCRMQLHWAIGNVSLEYWQDTWLSLSEKKNQRGLHACHAIYIARRMAYLLSDRWATKAGLPGLISVFYEEIVRPCLSCLTPSWRGWMLGDNFIPSNLSQRDSCTTAFSLAGIAWFPLSNSFACNYQDITCKRLFARWHEHAASQIRSRSRKCKRWWRDAHLAGSSTSRLACLPNNGSRPVNGLNAHTESKWRHIERQTCAAPCIHGWPVLTDTYAATRRSHDADRNLQEASWHAWLF